MVGLRPGWLAALVASALLAGCAAGPSASGDPEALPALSAGKGAIAGLLVDDRYRPLRLTQTPEAEFEAAGFLLVVETGERVTTDGNGEFTVLDLEPGTYTIKPAVEGHEGAPAKVDVAAGQYSEVDILVRRLVTPPSDTVIVRDDTLLVTCQVQVLDGHFTVGRLCHGDLASDGESTWVDYNYTGFPTPQAVVVEATFSRVGDYEIWLTKQANLIDGSNLYAKEYAFGTDYFRFQMLNGSEEGGQNSGVPLDTRDLRVWVNVDYAGTKETYDVFGFGMSAGFTFVVEARLVVSAFLQVPADLDSYSVLR